MGHLVLERMYPAQLLLQKLAGAWVGPGWGLGGAWTHKWFEFMAQVL